jgi:hypothetical protein
MLALTSIRGFRKLGTKTNLRKMICLFLILMKMEFKKINIDKSKSKIMLVVGTTIINIITINMVTIQRIMKQVKAKVQIKVKNTYKKTVLIVLIEASIPAI